MPRLKLVANFGVGYDALNLDILKKLGVKVTNTPEVLSDTVADLCMALILASSRNLYQG